MIGCGSRLSVCWITAATSRSSSLLQLKPLVQLFCHCCYYSRTLVTAVTLRGVLVILVARCWFCQEQPRGAPARKDLHAQQNRGNLANRRLLQRTLRGLRFQDSLDPCYALQIPNPCKRFPHNAFRFLCTWRPWLKLRSCTGKDACICGCFGLFENCFRHLL